MLSDVVLSPFLLYTQLQQTLNRQPGVPSLVRYSDFLDMVEKGQIEKVTFSADGQKLVATDTDGAR